jgi:hypothetical protein
MKVIFLDVDGVICVDNKICIKHIKRLQSIVERTGAKIVLSSNWRLYQNFFDNISSLLSRFNMTIIGMTPNIENARPYEIFVWLKKYKPSTCVILDDRMLNLEPSGFRISQCFFNCKTTIGLTDAIVESAVDFLNYRSITISTKQVTAKFIYERFSHAPKKARVTRRGTTTFRNTPVMFSCSRSTRAKVVPDLSLFKQSIVDVPEFTRSVKDAVENTRLQKAITEYNNYAHPIQILSQSTSQKKSNYEEQTRLARSLPMKRVRFEEHC